MISDGERREIAERLRYSANECDEGLGASGGEVLSVLGVGIGESEDFSNKDDVLRLADLIDRPTCRDVNAKAKGPACDMFECSECGFDINTWDMEGGWKRIRYCPNCGAQVVRDE